MKKRKQIISLGIVVCIAVACMGCGKGQNGSNSQNGTRTEQRLEIPQDFQYEEAQLESWKKTLPGLLEPRLYTEAIRGVEILRGGETRLAVSYEPRTYKNTYDCWAISEPYHSLVYVDTEAMYDFFTRITTLDFQNAGALDESHFTGETDQIYVAYFSRQTEEGGAIEPDAGLWITVGAEAQEKRRYVKIDGMEDMFTVEEEAIQAVLQQDPFQMVLGVVNVVMMNTVSQLEIATKDSYHTMQLSNDSYQWDGQEVGFDAYNTLYTEIMSMFVSKEIPKDYQQTKDADCLLSLHYMRNVEKAPEIYVQYFAYDDENAAVWINGEPLFLVERSQVEVLIHKIEAGIGK